MTESRDDRPIRITTDEVRDRAAAVLERVIAGGNTMMVHLPDALDISRNRVGEPSAVILPAAQFRTLTERAELGRLVAAHIETQRG